MATGVTSLLQRTHEVTELTYDSKLAVSAVRQLPRAELRLAKDGGSKNRLYYGDNLSVMLSLLDDNAVNGHIRCVYLDPPFATQMSFVDRHHRHAYEDRLDGGAFIEFLRRRLIVARDLMANDGSIFVHLDQKMVFEIKLVMDEIFGKRNFRNFITRKKCNTKNYTRNVFGNISDHILFYSKTDRYVWNRLFEPWSEKRIVEEYSYIDEKTGRRYKKVPIHAPGIRNGSTGRAWRGLRPPPGKHWQYTPDKLEAMDKAGEIYWSPNGNPRRKVFLNLKKGIPVQDVWLDFKDAHNQNIRITGYPTEKSYELLKRIVSASSNKEDMIMDCFCGSGTTLEAAHELGRRFIGIDNSEMAIQTTIKRLQAGRERMGDYVGTKARRQGIEHQAELFTLSHSSPSHSSPLSSPSFSLYISSDNPLVNNGLRLES